MDTFKWRRRFLSIALSILQKQPFTLFGNASKIDEVNISWLTCISLLVSSYVKKEYYSRLQYYMEQYAIKLQ